jgi:membrane protease YdiL (CAAX protease family)
MEKLRIDDSRTQPSAQSSAEKRPRSFVGLLKNPFVVCYAVLYFVFLVLLVALERFGLAEPILILIVIGAGFSSLAWWLTKGVKPLTIPVKWPRLECVLLILYLLVLVVPFLTWGMNLIRSSFTTEPVRSVVVLAAKLTVIVLVPLLLLGRLGRYRLRDFISFSFDWKKHLRVALWVSLAFILLQMVNSGLAPIKQAGFSIRQWGIGIPFAFLWLTVETGLVEEFFFRAIIQSRFASLLRSEIGGVVVMAVLFGLAHAPGIYLRAADTSVGASPSPLMAIGYSIVVLSVTGFFVGVLWSRTRNLVVLVLVHAAGDLVPNMIPLIKIWFVR